MKNDKNKKGIYIPDKERNSLKYQIREYLYELIKSQKGMKTLEEYLNTSDIEHLQFSEINVFDTANSKFGDLTSNVAMTVEYEEKNPGGKGIELNPSDEEERVAFYAPNSNPYQLSIKLQELIEKDKLENPKQGIHRFVSKIEVAKPGFINFYLSEDYLFGNLWNILKLKDKYGTSEFGKGKKVMVEYGQANTHKAIHIGHIKNYVSGQALIKLLENFDFDVVKANYYGDIGMHVAKCIWGAMNSKIPEGLDSKTPDEKMDFLQNVYVFGANKFKEDVNAEKEIRKVNKELYSKENPEINKLYEMTRKWSLEHQAEVFEMLGVEYDRQYPESEVAIIGKKIVEENIPAIFKKNQGAVIYEGSKHGLHNRVFISSEGNVTYEGKDIGLAVIKFEEFNLFRSFYFVATEQTEYFKVIFEAIRELNPEIASKSAHIGFGMLLIKGKKESSRSGVSMTGKQLLDETISLAESKIQEKGGFNAEEIKKIARVVGINSVRYMIMQHPYPVDVSFNPDKALSIDGKSAPYLMYTYARAMSIVRERGKDMVFSGDMARARSAYAGKHALPPQSDEIELLRFLSKYQDVTADALNKLSPHLIANYVYELAQAYNAFYKENPVLKAESEELKQIRLVITAGVAQVLHNGLNLLGIETLERM